MVAIPERILVVEDEADVAALIAYQLAKAGFRVETAASGAEGLEAIGREVPDLLVLDRMLPGLSGDAVLRAIRSDGSTSTLPVLILTAKRETEDRIEALEIGADDYLTKPFSPRELVLRVQAILRRSADSLSSGGGRALRAGPFRLDLEAHEVVVNGREVRLTPTEFKLLRVLVERAGRTQTRRQLLEEVWEVEPAVSSRLNTRTVDMHVRRLRAKLGKLGSCITTVRGFGYRFRPPEAGAG